MAVDLAIDYNSGDLLVAPNKDIATRTGASTVEQRIRVRLRVIQGEWILDPTGGTLGSRLREAMRLPVFRAVQEVPLLVREALLPMTDIDVTDVECVSDDTDSTAVAITIIYSTLDDTGQTNLEGLSTTLTLTE